MTSSILVERLFGFYTFHRSFGNRQWHAEIERPCPFILALVSCLCIMENDLQPGLGLGT